MKKLKDKFKVTRFDEAVFDEFESLFIANEESFPKALETFEKYKSQLSDFAYWVILGLLWRTNPDIKYLEFWHTNLSSTRPKRSYLMDDKERHWFRVQPKTVRVFWPKEEYDHLGDNGPKPFDRIEFFPSGKLAATGVPHGTPIMTAEVPRENIIAMMAVNGKEEVSFIILQSSLNPMWG